MKHRIFLDINIFLMLSLYSTLHPGKTTILYRLMLKEHIFTTPTLGYNSETFTPIAGSTFTMLDLGDWPKLRTRDWHHHHDAEGMQITCLKDCFSFFRLFVICQFLSFLKYYCICLFVIVNLSGWSCTKQITH